MPGQRRLLRRYERRLLAEGKSPTEAKRARLTLTALFKNQDMWGTPWENKIRSAIHRDRRALRHLRYLVREQHEHSELDAEFHLIVRLSMWAHVHDWNPSLPRMRKDKFVPRDELLLFLRDRGAKGATHSELLKRWPYYATYFSDLRAKGFEFTSTRRESIEGDQDFRRFVLKEPNKRFRYASRHQEYEQIAKAIENLGKPPVLREAGAYARRMAKNELALDDVSLSQQSRAIRFKRIFQDDLLQFYGSHLKRITYLMAVADKTAHNLDTPVEKLAEPLFWTLHRRRYPRRKK